ncbi:MULTISPECIES: hypothetical protein [unclassified Pseudoalteromonas]|uniref:hypothetical protein n=1 Tax=unclassified Pseudoalteromonas TaxID=194690 RepID=UPI0020984BB3|nr:hypothetical protein [Pseudoalteromonas sp. XMcav2-N]MCO7190682.1 hypothetical protein [Pseudoalteromonas sp. XMcav2-N]
MLKVKTILLLLLLAGSFTVVQMLDRPVNDIFVSEEELGMSLEEQVFFEEDQAQQFIDDKYNKREALLRVKLAERQERLSILKHCSLFLVFVSLITVFIVGAEKIRVLYAGLLLTFALIEWWLYGLSGLVLALILISIIQVIFYIYKDEQLPPDWDQNIKSKKGDED